jgi:hypothetical protein
MRVEPLPNATGETMTFPNHFRLKKPHRSGAKEHELGDFSGSVGRPGGGSAAADQASESGYPVAGWRNGRFGSAEVRLHFYFTFSGGCL